MQVRGMSMRKMRAGWSPLLRLFASKWRHRLRGFQSTTHQHAFANASRHQFGIWAPLTFCPRLALAVSARDWACAFLSLSAPVDSNWSRKCGFVGHGFAFLRYAVYVCKHTHTRPLMPCCLVLPLLRYHLASFGISSLMST